MDALHRYLLWSVQQRENDIVNFVIQATGFFFTLSMLPIKYVLTVESYVVPGGDAAVLRI